MIATLSGRTTREQLERETKDGLVGLMAAYAPSLANTAKRMTKIDLVTSLMAVVAEKARADEAKAAADEAARQETLDAEKTAGRVQTGLEHLLQSTNHLIDEANKTIADFQAEVAKGPWEIQSVITWRCEKVLEAIAALREFLGLQKYLIERIEKQDKTAHEIEVCLAELAGQAIRTCLDGGYRHCSTNALDNVNNMAWFAAKQTGAKFYRRAVKAWAKAIEGGDLAELGFIRAY